MIIVRRIILFIYNLSYLGMLRNIKKFDGAVVNYITIHFDVIYKELLKYLVTSHSVQYSSLRGLLSIKGEQFIKDIVEAYQLYNKEKNNIFSALYKVQSELKKIYLDTRILDIAIRYYEVGAVSDRELKNIFINFINCRIAPIKKKLLDKIDDFNCKLIEITSKEIGSEVIRTNIEEETNKVCKILQFFGDQR